MIVRALQLVSLTALAGCQFADQYEAPDAAVPVAPAEEALLSARPYRLFVPEGYDGGGAWPLVLGLHGYGGSSAEEVSLWALGSVAKDRQLFVAVPQGRVDALGNRAWHPGPVHPPSWDVEYLTAIIHQLEARYAIDRARVYVYGHSQGAHMAHRMGCDASQDVAAFVSIAGQVTKRASDCAPPNLVSALEVHGTADEVIGYSGDVQNDPPDPNVPSAHETIATWARNDRCQGALSPTGVTLDLSTLIPGEETVVEAYAGCPSGTSVELWTMNGVHHWPDPQPDFMDRLIDFLEAHPRP